MSEVQRFFGQVPIGRQSVTAAAFVLFLYLPPSSAQTPADIVPILRESTRQAVEASEFGSGYAAIINFASEPNISSSHLWIDSGDLNDSKLNVFKLPLSYEFDLPGHSWRPFVRATLAKLDLERTTSVFDTEKIKPKWESYGVSVGGGVRIPLTENWSILPSVDVGYAGLSSSAKYSGVLANAYLKPAFQHLLVDWSADTWLASGHLALQYREAFQKLDIDAKLSGTASHIETFRTTTQLQAFSENIGTISFKIDGTYPLGISLAGHPLSVIGHLGSSTFVGSNRDALGFTYVNEAGLSLQADISRYGFPVSKLSVGAMGLWGDNVKGWSFLFGYQF